MEWREHEKGYFSYRASKDEILVLVKLGKISSTSWAAFTKRRVGKSSLFKTIALGTVFTANTEQEAKDYVLTEYEKLKWDELIGV